MSQTPTDQAAVVAQVLVGAITRRMRQARHSWVPGHLLAHGVLTDLLTAAPDINRDFLQQVADLIAAELPDNAAEPPPVATVVNTITGPVAGTVAQVGVVHGGPSNERAVAAAVTAGLAVLAKTGVTRVHVSY